MGVSVRWRDLTNRGDVEEVEVFGPLEWGSEVAEEIVATCFRADSHINITRLEIVAPVEVAGVYRVERVEEVSFQAFQEGAT